MIHTESLKGERETFCIRQDLLPLWFATINVSRVKPELQDKLYLYQKEAGKVLAEHFLGKKLSGESPFQLDTEDLQIALKSIHPSSCRIVRLSFGIWLNTQKMLIPHGQLTQLFHQLGIKERTARK